MTLTRRAQYVDCYALCRSLCRLLEFQPCRLMYTVIHAQNINPGTWGKADQATMARRKVVRARRAGAAAEPAPAAEGPGSEQAAGSNPFAGVSLGSAANPFAGVSIVAPAKVSTAENCIGLTNSPGLWTPAQSLCGTCQAHHHCSD